MAEYVHILGVAPKDIEELTEADLEAWANGPLFDSTERDTRRLIARSWCEVFRLRDRVKKLEADLADLRSYACSTGRER